VQSPGDFLARYGYLGLAALLFLEEAGVPLPLPGDLFIAAMGFMARQGRASFAPTALAVTAATVLGAAVLFNVARHAGRPLLLRVARRFGYTAKRERAVEGWLSRRGFAAVVVGRLVPGLRIVMTVVAGALRMSQATFSAGTALAGLVWATLYFWMGWLVGAGYDRLAPRLGLSDLAPIAAAGLALAAGGVLAFRAWRRRRAAVAPARVDPNL
jgi:membrane protein DedA with SNARE-associated domain